MKKVMEVMTKDVETINPNDSLKDAAEKMRTLNVGPLPVCDGDNLMGILTDRDIVVRAVSQGMDPNNTRVSQAMTDDIEYVYENDDIGKVAQKMKDEQIRRILVVNQDKKLVGIVALGDLAEAMNTREAGSTLESISEPSQPSSH
ncbi:CBS domain-containing protein [Pyxidicoccus fallax]|uniref:CBS domain-containing protein n=1 Tax=Pyxidicoccus fallax TaxID=394095 RepID=A0A848LRD3_9BACT|nr:CBS domain-containing protein [Pyxidicoccus fallax]NMO20326.1 CBS domain-containing protein [Pyxidicoccus fallax]NPC81082.1 CBS domain-containing protein [Pyxidicoccus fallax]